MTVNPYANHKNDYLRNQVMSASPNKLIEMLIEGAVKSIRKAGLAIDNRNIELANNEIVHAQDIVDELKFSVNTEVEGDIPKQLVATYDLIGNELVQANVHKDRNHLDIAQKMLEEVLDAWRQITK